MSEDNIRMKLQQAIGDWAPPPGLEQVARARLADPPPERSLRGAGLLAGGLAALIVVGLVGWYAQSGPATEPQTCPENAAGGGQKGYIYTVVGSGLAFSKTYNNGVCAASAAPSALESVAFDAAGTLYFSDRSDNRIWRVTATGRLQVVAGTGFQGYSGDGGPATAAQIAAPFGIAFDQAGNLYIAEYNGHRVRRITPAGVITTIAGTGKEGYSGDGGPAINAQLDSPAGVAADAAGNIYIADSTNNRIRRVDRAGVISTVAGGGTGPLGDGGRAVNAVLALPLRVAVDTSGSLYIADGLNYRVRKVTPDGIITTVAGNGIAGSGGDGEAAVKASINGGCCVAVASDGTIYISEERGNRVRAVQPDGTIRTVAGNGTAGFSGDGRPAVEAKISSPRGVALDPQGNLYVVDPQNGRIREIVSPG